MDINAAMTTATAQMIDAIGLSMTYTPQGGQAKTITALFDNEAQTINLISGGVGSSAPKVFAKTSDLPTAKKGDGFTINSVNYTVTEVNPDGTGGTELILKKT